MSWKLAPFLSEAVEASRCYFFENCFMKHKWVTLLTMQSEIYYQNSQSFYPSELFTLDHFFMRHPVRNDGNTQPKNHLQSSLESSYSNYLLGQKYRISGFTFWGSSFINAKFLRCIPTFPMITLLTKKLLPCHI